jgi:NAD(P)-dependent dehydrogenase (short-subunit alcohol dehydrogenase family)
MSDRPFEGRRALVIGVETPAGAAIARALGAAGAALGLATMRADEGVLVAKRIQREVQAAGGVAATYAFDVTLGQNVKVSTRQVTKELGGRDLLVSASDRFLAAPLGRTTDSDLAAVMVTNCYSHLFAVRAAADEFRRNSEPGGAGRALLVAHAAGEAGLPGAAAYAAAHGATLLLAKSLAEELRPRGIGLDTLVVGTAAWTDEAQSTLVPQLPGAAAEALGQLALRLLAEPSDGASGRVERFEAVPGVSA